MVSDLDPTLAGILTQGLAFQEEGRLADAEKVFRSVLAIDSRQPETLHLLGMNLGFQGRLPEAVELLEKAAALDPANAELRNNLGTLLKGAGRLEAAMAAYRKAAEIDTAYPEPHHNMAVLLREAGRIREAAALFEHATRLAPRMAMAHNGLGAALRDLGRLAEAEAALRRALAIQPGYAEAWTHLGSVLCDLGRAAEGAEACARAVEVKPSVPELRRNLATALKQAARYDEARAALEKAVALRPAFVEAWIDLGILYRDRRRMDAAVTACEKAISLAPGNSVPYKVMAQALYQGGRWREAEAALDRAIQAAPGDAGLLFRRALVLPVMPASRAEMEEGRRQLETRLDELLARSDPRLEDPYREVAMTDFYLAFQGENDRPLREKLAALYLKACPGLAWTAPHCASGPRREGRLRVGFLSLLLHEAHTIAKLNIGLIGHLPRDRFETFVIGGRSEAAEHSVALPIDLERARQAVAGLELDVLIYPDLGMEPFTWFLAFARLAPAQAVTWGHPVTTGIPAVDWFLSTADLDPPGAEAAYSEKLFRLPAFPAFVRRPFAADPPTRAQLGLPDGHLYVCTQTLFKIHPDFDNVLAAILARDPQARLVFIEGVHDQIAGLLRRRFERTLPDGLARVHFLPALDEARFLGLCAAADALLDPFPFCGGNTSLEAFAMGGPVVTLPTALMRGRVTYAFYRRMGIDDLIARDPDHYVDLALRLAADPDWRAGIVARIRERSGRLFEDAEAVAGLAAFLDKAGGREP